MKVMEYEKKKDKIFVARQPIFTKEQNVYGYELLFRNNQDNYFDQTINQDYASSKTLMDSFLLFGMQELTHQKRAFINLTKKNLLKDYISAVPYGQIVVELLETIEPDAETIAICKKLKKNGYVIALDDFIFEEKYFPLIDVADIIKIDFMNTKGDNRKHVIRDIDTKKIKFLAEKVETPEDFREASDAGYTYYQGYFFSKPVIVSMKELPSYKPHLLLLLKEVMSPSLDLNKIENLIKHDVSIAYKLLRFINSAAFGFFTVIKSIRHAVNLLGESEIKKWISVIILSQIGRDKPDQLIQLSVTRARFCESIIDQTPLLDRKADAFMMGMFSLLDTLMGRSMEEVLEFLPMAADIKGALLGEQNGFKDVLEIAVQYEKGNWDAAREFSDCISLPFSVLPHFYMEAVTWANSLESADVN
ncbi:MAG: HDOD domain-containing protein [bacterium]|nr:HDOD domain-containing protein [bacterium]